MLSRITRSIVAIHFLLVTGIFGEQQLLLPDAPQPKRVAIIGAGAAGASTAYYLRNASLHSGIPLNLTIYERNPYIGGRSTTINAFNIPTEPIELGASIFVSVNHNLVNAVHDLGLGTTYGLSGPRHTTEEDRDDVDTLLGIWDGEGFVYRQPTSTPTTRFAQWYRSLRLLYHYGIMPIRLLRLVNSTVSRFLKLYEAPQFPFSSLESAVFELGLSDTVASSGWNVLGKEGLQGRFTWEVVQAATRVNYASDLAGIHGMGMLVSMATDGAMSVEGGNWRIFEGMVKDSNADARLNMVVESIEKLKPVVEDGEDLSGGYVVRSRQAAREQDEECGTSLEEVEEEEIVDEVVLAAPFHQTGISFTGDDTLAHIPNNDTYRTLHVTLFSSPYRLDPLYFQIRDNGQVPTTVLTTLPGPIGSQSDFNHASAKGSFYSISTLRSIQNPYTSEKEYLYKIFSPAPFSNASLAEILDTSDTLDTKDNPRSAPLRPGDISWIYTKKWLSYPILKPRTAFEQIRLDLQDGHDSIRSSSRGGIWYTAGMEGFISTMETSSLMGANVARLMVDGWIRQSSQERVVAR